MSIKLIAFHGKPEIKQQYLDRVRAHRAADEIIKGTYWEPGKGCAVGCTIHGSDHAKYETELGIPRLLARVEDGIFENLPNGTALEWPEKFLEAIKIGSDLSLVGSQFLHWLLVDPADGVIRFERADGKLAIQRVADLYQRQINRETISEKEWSYDADAADAAADADAAKTKARIRQSEKLLELLRAAPTGELPL